MAPQSPRRRVRLPRRPAPALPHRVRTGPSLVARSQPCRGESSLRPCDLAHRRQREADPPPGLSLWLVVVCKPRPGALAAGPSKSLLCSAENCLVHSFPSHRFRERRPGRSSLQSRQGRRVVPRTMPQGRGAYASPLLSFAKVLSRHGTTRELRFVTFLRRLVRDPTRVIPNCETSRAR